MARTTEIIVNILGLAFFGFCIWFMMALVGMLSDRNSEQKSHIGEVYILEGDSLIITNWSLLDETYTLSNGVTIHKSLITSDE